MSRQLKNKLKKSKTKSYLSVAEQQLIKDFISVINHCPNIEEMMEDSRFDLELMYNLYEKWMNVHYPNKNKLNFGDFYYEFGLIVGVNCKCIQNHYNK